MSHRGERFAVAKPPVGDVFRTLIPVTEQSTGLLYRGVGTAVATQPFIANTTSPSNAQVSLTFVTGTHALKVGFNDTWGGRHATYVSPQRNIMRKRSEEIVDDLKPIRRETPRVPRSLLNRLDAGQKAKLRPYRACGRA